MKYIIQSKGAKMGYDTVIAPTGYYRSSNGKIIKDRTPSPEMGHIKDAYYFLTHRAAARVAAKLAFPIIRQVNYLI